MENEKLPLVRRTIYFVAMLIFIGPAVFMLGIIVNALYLGKWGALSFFILCLLFTWGFGWTAYMFGYKVFMPVARHGWIKNKIKVLAPLMTVSSFLVLAIAIPPYNQYKYRGYNSEAKSNLHHMYMTCQTYWQENGDDKNCDLKIITGKEYGFVPSAQVSISGNGTAKDFTATARHEAGTRPFMMDSHGNISEQPLPRP